MPKRVQRKRTKGWKMPPGAVYVGRPTIWGNPFETAGEFSVWLNRETMNLWPWLTEKREEILMRVADLRGKDLACWCPLDQPCHADVLLEIANA